MSDLETEGGDPLEAVFKRLGADSRQAATCARQLRKRALQKAEAEGISELAALSELLDRMARAAAETGLGSGLVADDKPTIRGEPA